MTLPPGNPQAGTGVFAASIIALYVDQPTLLESAPWLSAKMLSAWHRDGMPRFTGKCGVSVYRVADIEQRIEQGMIACQEDGSNTKAGGSAGSPEAQNGTKTGMTQSEEERAAEALAQQI